MPLVIAFFLGIILQLGGIIPPPPPPGGSELSTSVNGAQGQGDANPQCNDWYEKCHRECAETDTSCEAQKKGACKQYYSEQHNCQTNMPISLGLELFLFFTGLFLLYFFHQKRTSRFLWNS